MKTNFFFSIVTSGGVELCMTQFPSLNFSIFNLFLAHLHGNFQCFAYFWPNLVQYGINFIQFHLKSIIFFKNFWKIMSQFLEGEGVGFFIFVTISYSKIPGGWFSPNLINVISFTVFFLKLFSSIKRLRC